MRLASQCLSGLAPYFMAVWLGTGCLDWDSLRGGVDAQSPDAAPDMAIAQTETPAVEWFFAEIAADLIADSAKAEPDVVLMLKPPMTSTAGLVQEKALWMRDLVGESTAAASRLMGEAITKAGGGFSFELWMKLPPGSQPGQLLLTPAINVNVSGTSLTVFANTSSGEIDLTYPWTTDGGWHHFGITFHPGLTALFTLYLDGKPVLAWANDKPTVSSTLQWSMEDVNAVIRLGSEDLDQLRLSRGALFTFALSETQMQKRFALGRNR